jgi:DNA-binding transcriptional LysR family regulator
MEVRAIGYFLAIAEEGSLRGAAARLGLTQPALTKAIRRLEDEAGVRLFERTSRGVTLTPYGRAFLRHARSLGASLAEATREIEALRAGRSGEVRLGAGPSWQYRVLPEAISVFRRDWPGVRVTAVGGLDDALKGQLRAGALDFVLAATPDAPQLEPDLLWRPLIADDYRVVARLGHPLREHGELGLHDLLAFPWILANATSQMAERLRILFRAQGLPPPEPAIETDVIPLQLALMSEGDYLGFHAASHLADVGPVNVQPLDLPEATWRRAAGIITRAAGSLGPAAARLVACIEASCKEESPSGHKRAAGAEA